MLDKPKSMCFQEGGGNLVVTVDDIGTNWRSKPQDNYKVSRISQLIGSTWNIYTLISELWPTVTVMKHFHGLYR